MGGFIEMSLFHNKNDETWDNHEFTVSSCKSKQYFPCHISCLLCTYLHKSKRTHTVASYIFKSANVSIFLFIIHSDEHAIVN